MNALRSRLSGVLKRYGEAFTVGGAATTGIFCPLPPERAKTYLTDAEVAAASRPMWLSYVPHDDPSTVAASVAWNSLALTVKRIVDVRVQGATVGKILVLA